MTEQPNAATAQPRASYAIERRLALRLAAVIAAILALLAFFIYCAAWQLIDRKQETYHSSRIASVARFIEDNARTSGPAVVHESLESTKYRRPQTRLTVVTAAGADFYRDPDEAVFQLEHPRAARADVDLRPYGGQQLVVTLETDTAQDRELLADLGSTLLAVPLLGGLLVAGATIWRVRSELRPLEELAARTERITPDRLDERLALPEVAQELLPWLTQFNQLMDRLQAAVRQLEAFNADVAHELRTPISALMARAEVALSRERDAGEWRETVASSLEDIQNLSGMVEDMLFLSRADRGATARVGEPGGLAALAREVVEFHEPLIEDAGLSCCVEGEAVRAVDAGLWKRAVSNLLENATRYADPGSRITVRIESMAGGETVVAVENRGPALESVDLPRLFDRFFRADVSRADSEMHHGLGLAIVAAIARMHRGRPFAHSANGLTRIGFSLPAPTAPEPSVLPGRRVEPDGRHPTDTLITR
jgi:two-component system heavy metal sensor histidine kinase CusS